MPFCSCMFVAVKTLIYLLVIDGCILRRWGDIVTKVTGPDGGGVKPTRSCCSFPQNLLGFPLLFGVLDSDRCVYRRKTIWRG